MRRRQHRVAVIALPGVIPFELSIPARVFGCALDADGRALYDVVTCSVDGCPVTTAADFSIVVAHDLRVLRGADTVIVPPAQLADLPARTLVALGAALRSVRRRARLASICTGIDVLASAGLLDGRPATTHWLHTDAFRARHPRVDLNADVLYVDDGNLLTSAGAASGIDLCLHIVRSDHGAEIANQVARSCVVPPHRDGGQAQYIDRPVPTAAHTSTADTRAWALGRLDTPLTLADLAEHAAMSVRTFTRRFREEVGVSPNRWLTQQRIEVARRLLETTDLPIDRVADRVGIGTAASLRLHLSAAIGVPPSTYRRTFRARQTRAPAASRL